MTRPLKPSLATVHPRAPRPKEQRPVICPRCDHKFNISRKAYSVRCPRCTQPLRLEDFHLETQVHRDLNTMGEVVITPISELVGNIHCGQLINQGKYAGKAKVYGRVILTPDSVTRGEIIGKSLSAMLGACLRGKAAIGPAGTTLTPAERVQRQQKQSSRLRVLSVRRKAG